MMIRNRFRNRCFDHRSCASPKTSKRLRFSRAYLGSFRYYGSAREVVVVTAPGANGTQVCALPAVCVGAGV